MNRRFTVALACAVVACDPMPEKQIGAVPEQMLAVIATDYVSTALSLVDASTNTVYMDSCLHSGTQAPRLTTALSGDVMFPTSAQHSGELILIDRYNNVLTWVDRNCTPLRQLSVKGTSTNPRDVVSISRTKAYVPRFGSMAADAQDVLIIDPTQPAVVGSIDLSSAATSIEGVQMLAHPDRAVLFDGRVYVTLGNYSADYKTAADGRLAIIDAATDKLIGTVELTGKRGCSSVTLDESTRRLFVSCGGSYQDPSIQVEGSAVVVVDVSTPVPEVIRTLPASSMFKGRPVSLSPVVALSGTFLVSTTGNFDSAPQDRLLSFEPSDRPVETVFETDKPFVIGGAVGFSALNRAFVAVGDAANPRVEVIEVSAGTAKRSASFKSHPASGLPPREVARF